MKRAATLVLVMLAMSASAAVDARALAREGQKTQWAPTRNFSSLNARAVFGGESRRATSPYAGEERETAAGEKDWQYAAGNPTRYTDPDGRAIPSIPTVGAPPNFLFCLGLSDAQCRREREGAALSVAQAAVGLDCALTKCAVTGAALRFGGVGYTAAYFAGVKGHRENGTLIESIPDPGTAAIDGVQNAALECRENPGVTMACGMTALAVAPPVLQGTRALMSTNAVRSTAAALMLESAPLLVEEGALVSIAEFPAVPAVRAASLGSATPLVYSSRGAPVVADGLKDVPFDPVKLQKIRKALAGKVEFSVDPEWLARGGNEAEFFPGSKRPSTIILQSNPSRGAVIEELLHYGQWQKAQKQGRTVKEFLEEQRIVQGEIEAQERLLRLQFWNEHERASFLKNLQYWKSKVQE